MRASAGKELEAQGGGPLSSRNNIHSSNSTNNLEQLSPNLLIER